MPRQPLLRAGRRLLAAASATSTSAADGAARPITAPTAALTTATAAVATRPATADVTATAADSGRAE